MSALQSPGVLTSGECELLLSLPDSDLETWLRQFPTDVQRSLVLQLAGYRTETERLSESLHAFVVAAWPLVEPRHPFVDGWHIRAICEHAEELLRPDPRFRDMLVNVPPGTMKSLLLAVFLPCFAWGPAGWPESRWMFASYSGQFSARDSLKRRNLLASDWFQSRWPLRFAPDQNARSQYNNDRSGWMFATSVDGQGTGEHPDFIVADDPHNAKQAASPAERRHVVEWWGSTIQSRGILLDVRRIVVMQRLHKDDLSGLLLREGGWCHLCLPMEYEPDRMPVTPLGWTDPRTTIGEPLWPEGITGPRMARLKKMPLSDQAGQLQQRPPDHDQGAEWPDSYFPPSIWFEAWPPDETFVLTVIGLDPSLGKTEKSDYSAFVTVKLDRDSTLWVDCDMERRDSAKMVARAMELTESERPVAFGCEANGFQSLLAGEIARQSHGRGMLCPVWQITNTDSKVSRIRRLTPYLAQGKLRIRDTPGGRLLEEQLRAFPQGRHDDGPDALEQAIRLMLDLSRGEEADETLIETVEVG